MLTLHIFTRLVCHNALLCQDNTVVASSSSANLRGEHRGLEDDPPENTDHVEEDVYVELVPGDAFDDPLDDGEVMSLHDLLPKNGPLAFMQVSPGQGTLKKNFKGLINSGKPFLLNGLDEETRRDIMDEIGVQLPYANQPYVIIVPHKFKNERYFQIIDSQAPLQADTMDLKREFTSQFLFLADTMVNADKRRNNEQEQNSNGAGHGRHLAGTVLRSNTISTVTFYGFRPGQSSYTHQCWFNYHYEIYKTSAGKKDIVISSQGNWNSNYMWDSDKQKGFANGHITQRIVPAEGYRLLNSFPTNTNRVNTVSSTQSFALSGTAGVDKDGPSVGVGAGYSNSQTVNYSMKDWEILANGQNQWDFRQQFPFRVGFGSVDSPMKRSGGCLFEGGCLYELPTLSRGTFDFETLSHYSGPDHGWRPFGWKQTGRSCVYKDAGWFVGTIQTWTLFQQHGWHLNMYD